MRALGLILIVFLFGNMTCEEAGIDAPACIKTLIKADPQPLEVWRYRFENQTVYYLLNDCCDQFNSVYDTNCTLICHPSGGITGGGDGNCPEFHNTVKDGVLVWKKD